MDNLTHALTGALIARTLPGRWSGGEIEAAKLDPDAPRARPGRWVMWSSVVAANLPDFEALVLWPPPLGDKATYLLHHRGWSHSLVGIAGEAVAFALLLWLLCRWKRTAGCFAGFTPLRGLAVALLGVGSHLFLDWWNSYGVRPFYPWDKSWYYGDLVFIADPWVWLMLGGAIVCGTRRFGRTKWLWYGSTLAATFTVAAACYTGRCPWWVLAAWLTGVAEIAALRWWGRWRGARWIGWGMVGAYLAAMVWVTASSPSLVERFESAGLTKYWNEPVAALPVPGIPWERAVVVRRKSESSYQWGRFSGTTKGMNWVVEPVSVLAPVVTTDGRRPQLGKWSMAIAENIASDLSLIRPRTAAAWQGFARFPVFRFSGSAQSGAFVFGDVRYLIRGEDWSALTVPSGGIETRAEWGADPWWQY